MVIATNVIFQAGNIFERHSIIVIRPRFDLGLPDGLLEFTQSEKKAVEWAWLPRVVGTWAASPRQQRIIRTSALGWPVLAPNNPNRCTRETARLAFSTTIAWQDAVTKVVSPSLRFHPSSNILRSIGSFRLVLALQHHQLAFRDMA